MGWSPGSRLCWPNEDTAQTGARIFCATVGIDVDRRGHEVSQISFHGKHQFCLGGWNDCIDVRWSMVDYTQAQRVQESLGGRCQCGVCRDRHICRFGRACGRAVLAFRWRIRHSWPCRSLPLLARWTTSPVTRLVNRYPRVPNSGNRALRRLHAQLRYTRR